MSGIYHLLIPLLSIFITRVDLTDLFPISFSGWEVQVLDGDTVRLNKKRMSLKARLLYIDAPEMNQFDGPTNLGEYASKCLKRLIKTKQTVLLHGYDIYGRALVEIKNVNLEMIHEGCAYIYPYSRFNERSKKVRYQTTQFHAQSLKKGLWKFKVLNPIHHRKQKRN